MKAALALLLFGPVFHVNNALLTSLPSKCEYNCRKTTLQECENVGCTWRPFKFPPCIGNTTRIKCGEYRDGEIACNQAGCIWSPTPTEIPSCYYPPPQPPKSGQGSQNHGKSICVASCSHTQDAGQCLALGCTWTDTSVPNCYKETDRITCAPNNVGKTGCASNNGCTWDKTNATLEPWCFYGPTPQVFINCHPDQNPNEEKCIARGCLWFEPSPYVSGPSCIFTDKAGYEFITGGYLRRHSTPALFGNPVQNVSFDIIFPGYPGIGILALENGNNDLDLEQTDQGENTGAQGLSWVVQKDPFGIQIYRESTGFSILDTRNLPGFTFEDSYTQISTRISTRNIYGFGEIAKTSLRQDIENWRNFSLWNHDPYGPDPERNPDLNLYGYHPFYLGVEPDGKAHGVLLYSTYPLNVAIQPDPDIITYRWTHDDTAQFAVAIYIMIGDSPAEVIEKYTAIVNKPVLPPYWGMGYQLSRYGYETLENMRSVYYRNIQAGIPIDVQFADIDYMDKYKDFTYDKTRFSGLPDFVKTLHDNHAYFVPIIDPGIASGDMSYKAYADGVSKDIFIKNSTGQYIEGVVWPGTLVFPDFSHPNTEDYWQDQLAYFHNQVPFDGVWYDMNEPTSLIDGSTVGCSQNQLNNPAYNPLNYGMDLLNMTLCNDAVTYKGTMLQNHNKYGFNEVRVGYRVAQNILPGKRPYILTRSSMMRSGQFAAHWSGDLYSTYAAMRYSIINMLDFGMFGMPWVGSDICGFHGNATEDLCVKWHQLGAFYPFARNHNDLGQRAQDPAAWSPDAQTKIRDAIATRYALLPTLYTEMVKSSITGRPAVRPLFFEYPIDTIALKIDNQFLWGTSMMVAPLLNEKTAGRVAYFPQGLWYRLDNQQFVNAADNGKYDSVISYLPLIRGGAILARQEFIGYTTYETRKSPLKLGVYLNATYEATGELFWDDGESTNPYTPGASGDFYHFQFHANVSCDRPDGAVVIKRMHKATLSIFDVPALQEVCVFGLPGVPESAKINGKSVRVEGQVGETDAVCFQADTPVTIADKDDVIVTFM